MVGTEPVKGVCDTEHPQGPDHKGLVVFTVPKAPDSDSDFEKEECPWESS